MLWAVEDMSVTWFMRMEVQNHLGLNVNSIKQQGSALENSSLSCGMATFMVIINARAQSKAKPMQQNTLLYFTYRLWVWRLKEPEETEETESKPCQEDDSQPTS